MWIPPTSTMPPQADKLKPDFFRALRPEPVRVLGVDLLPFSLGHAIHLKRFEAYPVMTPPDLLLALLVCSCRFDDLPAVLGDRWLPVKMKLWGWTHRNWDFALKMQAFHDYVSAGSLGPDIYEKDQHESMELPGAPWLAHLKTVLMAELGYSRTEVLNTPYGECLWDYYTHWENRKQVDIVDDSNGFAIRRQADEMHDSLLEIAHKMRN